MEIVDEVLASEFQLDLSTPDYQARQVSRFSSMVLEATLGHLSPVTVTNNRLLDDEHSRVLGSKHRETLMSLESNTGHPICRLHT